MRTPCCAARAAISATMCSPRTTGRHTPSRARRPLPAREGNQRPEVPAGICRLQRPDVVTAGSARLGQRGGAPAEPGAAERHDEGVGGEPRPPAVAVGERVDDHQPIAEPDRALVVAVACPGGVGEPGPNVVAENAHVHADLPVRHTEVPASGPVLSRPGPYLA